jgi:hypothetical protein
MKIYVLLLVLLLASGCATLFGPKAPAIDGKWEGTMEMMGQSNKISYEFESDGNTLTGTTTGPQNQMIEITNGKIDGSNISFDVPVDMGQMKMTVKYTGVLAEDELELTMKFDMPEGAPGGGQMPEIPPIKATRVMDAE